MARYVFDLESDGFVEELTVIHSLVFKDLKTLEVFSCYDHAGSTMSIKEGLDLLEVAEELIGHNIIEFDIPAIQKVYPEWQPQGKLTDTLYISRLIWTDLKNNDFAFRAKTPTFPGQLIGRHSLESWGWRLRMHKGDYSKEMKAEGKDPWAEWNQSMQDYCVQDVAVTSKFWQLIQRKNYSQEAIDLEHAFREPILLQEKAGFPLDEKAAQALYVELVKRRLEVEAEMQKVFLPWYMGKEVKHGSNARRFVICDKGSEKKYTRVTPAGNIVSKYRSDMSDRVWGGGKTWTYDSSGYFHYTDKGVPFTQISLVTFKPGSRDHIANRLIKMRGWKPKLFGADGKPTVDEEVLKELKYPEVKPLMSYLVVQKRIGQLAEGNQALLKLIKADGRIHGRVNTNGAVTGRCTHSHPNVAQTPANGKPFGKEFRALYHSPDPEWLLVGCDASGLELRCLAHYMARYDGGAYAKIILEGDIHTVNQEAAGLPTRDNAKTFIYGFLYGAGDAKIGSIVGKGARIGGKLRKQFLDRLPALEKLVRGVKHKAKTQGYLRGLDGRVLHVRHAHAALNTLLQSAGAIAMKKALVILYQSLGEAGLEFGRDYEFVANVHDEYQTLVRKEHVDTFSRLAVEAIRRAGEYYNFRCPLDGEAKVGRSWAETH